MALSRLQRKWGSGRGGLGVPHAVVCSELLLHQAYKQKTPFTLHGGHIEGCSHLGKLEIPSHANGVPGDSAVPPQKNETHYSREMKHKSTHRCGHRCSEQTANQ